MLSPDDVEADLDRILKDRLVTAEDDDDDEDEDEPDERGDPGDRLQPKRADEQLCPNCFLLVRANGPGLSRRRRRLPDLPLRTDDDGADRPTIRSGPRSSASSSRSSTATVVVPLRVATAVPRCVLRRLARQSGRSPSRCASCARSSTSPAPASAHAA